MELKRYEEIRDESKKIAQSFLEELCQFRRAEKSC